MKTNQNKLRLLYLGILSATMYCGSLNAQSWKTDGNAGINSANNYLGTSDANDLVFRTNAIERGRLFGAGNWRFGTTSNYVSIDASGILSFFGAAFYQVNKNEYVFKAANDPDIGMYFNNNSKQFEFRDKTGVSQASINFDNGNGIYNGTLSIRGSAIAGSALTVNTGAVLSGIAVNNPGNYTAFRSIKTGDSNVIYISNKKYDVTSAALQVEAYGTTTCIRGQSLDQGGIGIYGSAFNGKGVYGYDGSVGDGVRGRSSLGYGVAGTTSEGIAGVYGLGEYSGANGVYGVCSEYGTYGVEGYAQGDSAGVFGRALHGPGVEGKSAGNSAAGGYGGRFTSANYRGIYVSSSPSFYAGYFNGDLYTTGMYQTSDLKLKKNIKEFDNALEIINSLKPKNYEFKSEGIYGKMNLPKGNHYGLIAQEVEKVLPALIKEEAFNSNDLNPGSKENTEVENIKAINYTELIPVMIKAIQEQDKTIKAQNEKIELLTRKIENLAKNSPSEAAKNTNSVLSDGTNLLEQNRPNPFKNITTIPVNVPVAAKSAQLIFSDINGKPIQQIPVTSKGKNIVNFDAKNLQPGTYTYTLIIDGKITESKKMVITK